MNNNHAISAENHRAAASNLTAGDLYLSIMNAGMESILQAAALREEQRAAACIGFSSGSGACQVREFREGSAI